MLTRGVGIYLYWPMTAYIRARLGEKNGDSVCRPRLHPHQIRSRPMIQVSIHPRRQDMQEKTGELIMIAGLNMSYNPNVSPWVFGEMPCALLIWIMGSKLLSHVVLNLGRERSKGSYCGGFRNVLVGLPKLTKNTCPFDWGLSRCVITCDFLGLICSKFLQSSHDSAHIT